MPRLLAAALLSLVLLSGCAGTGAKGADLPSAAPVGDDDSSLLHGVIIDENLLPVEGAHARVEPGAHTATTDPVGAFTIGPLDEGAYTLAVTKDGFLIATA